jgi:acylphosphatase
MGLLSVFEEKDVKARLVIKELKEGEEERKLQGIGLRVYISGKILTSPLNGGAAMNKRDGSVEVLLEGKKGDIERFVEELKEERPELATNPVMIGPEYDDSLYVPDVMRYSQALQMEQLGKGISMFGEFNENLKGMAGFVKTLPRDIARELKKVIKG